jgi:hypothetical protein|tara:strand:+ start:300 stop:1253 length:954 start_codon:yes stop_codon:yes gene_type:complete
MTKNTFLILIITVLTFSNAANAGKLYRWVDENGKVSFSDKVPPKESKRERDVLNEKGRVIATKDAAKTPEQIQQLKTINDLQAVKEKLLQTQLAQDSALLNTFQSEADIEALAKSKFAMLDSHITIAMGQSETLKKQLISQQQAAANFERLGKKIPDKTVSNIQSAQGQFDKNQNEIVSFKLQKIILEEQLSKDTLRFKTLTTLSKETPKINSETIPNLVLGELVCKDINCQDLWQKACDFVAQQENINIAFISDNLLLTTTPTFSSARGLSLTKINDGKHTKILFDVRCANSKGGKETCQSEKTTRLIEEFDRLDD